MLKKVICLLATPRASVLLFTIKIRNHSQKYLVIQRQMGFYRRLECNWLVKSIDVLISKKTTLLMAEEVGRIVKRLCGRKGGRRMICEKKVA